MTDAILTLEDGPRLLGKFTAFNGNDARLRVRTQMTAEEVSRYRQGLIEIDEKMQRVMVKRVSSILNDEDALDITLGTFTASNI